MKINIPLVPLKNLLFFFAKKKKFLELSKYVLKKLKACKLIYLERENKKLK